MKPGGARQNGADGEADGDQPAEEIADDEEDHDADDGDGGVLPLEIGLRALADRGGDLLHLFAAGIGRQHRARGPDGVNDSQHAAKYDEPQGIHGSPRSIGGPESKPARKEWRLAYNGLAGGANRRGDRIKRPAAQRPRHRPSPHILEHDPLALTQILRPFPRKRESGDAFPLPIRKSIEPGPFPPRRLGRRPKPAFPGTAGCKRAAPSGTGAAGNSQTGIGPDWADALPPGSEVTSRRRPSSRGMMAM